MAILKSPEKLKAIIKKEFVELKEKFGTKEKQRL